MAEDSNFDGESNGQISPKEEAEELKSQANNLFKGNLENQPDLVKAGD